MRRLKFAGWNFTSYTMVDIRFGSLRIFLFCRQIKCWNDTFIVEFLSFCIIAFVVFRLVYFISYPVIVITKVLYWDHFSASTDISSKSSSTFIRVLRNLYFVAAWRVIVVMVYLICPILASLCVKNVLKMSYTLLVFSVSILFSSQYFMLLIVFWRSHLLRESFSCKLS